MAFPDTRVSIIAGLNAPAEETRRAAADLLARAYWAPVATTLRIRWQLEPADAEDLTQDFFANALEKEWLQQYDPARARFRTFLRLCVDRFASNAHAARHRLKRAGDATTVSLDEALAQPAESEDAADARFRQEWVRSVFALALDALRAEAERDGKETHVAVLRAYDIDDAQDGVRPTYRQLAERFSIPETQVTNYLAWARRALRGHVLEALRALAGSDAEFRSDCQELLGIRPDV